MKQILAYFLIALFISGCSQQATHVSETPPQSPPATTVPENSTNPQQALVIGNSNYEYSPLTHPVNDAKQMANRLKKMGFHVSLQTNLKHQAMTTAIQKFSQRLSNNPAEKSVGLFYFSGHGAQKNEQNFLLPINNDKLSAENDFKPNAVPAKTLVAKMANAHNGMNIIILDACYEEPYRNNSNTNTQGLARIAPPRGTLIAFAAEEGQTVSKRKTSLYTKTLVKVLEQAKHNRIEDVFMEIGEKVKQQSEGEQVPWYQASLRKAFCFGGCLE
jgi:uncharacterized caspase-like protein